MAKSIKIVCGYCGSDDVGRDAWAEWDLESQKWILGDVYDQGFCENCAEVADLEDLECDLLNDNFCKTITISVKGGCVTEIDNVPEGWSIVIDDQDGA